ncbi:MAG: type IV conjugative transfer system protein TraL [Proteobacteria bacterium]|nr:type IV conjugative transfer system protein TraL [Pseudomonadota bacterium]
MSTRGTMPRHIDSQPQFFWWEMDEFLVGFFIFGLGIIIGRWVSLLGIVAALVVISMMKRWKEGELDGGVQHIAYAAGVYSINPVYADGLKRDFWQ